MLLDNYRVLKISVENEIIVSGEWDFGCDIIAQDVIESSDGYSEVHKVGKFAFKIVEAILYRLLKNKVSDLSFLYDMSPDEIISISEQIIKWFSEDLAYMSEAMSALSSGVASTIASEQSDDVHRQLGYVGFTLFKNYNVHPSQYKSWPMSDVVDILYYSGYDSAKESLKNKNVVF